MCPEHLILYRNENVAANINLGISSFWDKFTDLYKSKMFPHINNRKVTIDHLH